MSLKINLIENGLFVRSLFFGDDFYMCDFTLLDKFSEKQKTAFLVASEFVFDLDWVKEKICKKEYELWNNVTDYKSLGRAVAESLDLPVWAYIYFDFEKFGYDIVAEHQGTLTSYGWFIFK